MIHDSVISYRIFHKLALLFFPPRIIGKYSQFIKQCTKNSVRRNTKPNRVFFSRIIIFVGGYLSANTFMESTHINFTIAHFPSFDFTIVKTKWMHFNTFYSFFCNIFRALAHSASGIYTHIFIR